MREAGLGLLGLGALIALGALALMDTAVSGTYNIGLLQRQALAFQGGLGLALMGAVLFAAGQTVRALGPGRAEPAPAADAPGQAGEGDATEFRYEVDPKAEAWTPYLVSGALVLLLFVVAALLIGKPPGTAADPSAATAFNAEAAADNMELMPDNMGAAQ